MPAVNVVISGFLYHGKSGQGTPVTIVGIAGLTDLEVGGGPVIPGGGPPGIWEPAYPTPPIYIPVPPPGVPSHPIELPPVNLPEPPDKPQPPKPSDKWQWVYDPNLGWVLVPPFGGGKPQPIPPGRGR